MLQPISRHYADASAAEQAEAEAPAASLVLLGLTSVLLSLHYARLFPFSPTVLAVGLVYGALGLIAAGLAAWRKHNVFGAVFGVAFGLFWLSLVAQIVLPENGFGRAPQPSALSSYLAFWGLFTSSLFTGVGRSGRVALTFLVMFAAFLLLLAAGAAAESELLNAIAGGAGIACGLAGMYAGISRLRN